MPVLFEFCQWLQETDISTSIRESNLLFPFIEGTHLLGLGISVGTIAMSDLRLLGVLMKKDRASKVFDSLLPFTIAGFAVVFATGSILFLAEPAKSYKNYWFWLKLTFMVLAGINALVYHSTVHKRIAQWDTALITPMGAKIAGVCSLVFWGMVIWLGRQFAYNH